MLPRVLRAFGLIVAFVAVAAVPLHSQAASSAGCNGFNGTWMTTWSGGSTTKMVISKGRGAYAYKGGTLSGTVSNGVFAGSYAENDGMNGQFSFKLGTDGNSFKGWYTTNADPGTRIYWNGLCTGS